MPFAGQVRDGGGDLGKGGVEVAAGDRRRGVAGEGLGDGVAGEATDRGDGRMAQHVRGHRSAVGPVETA